MSRLEKTQPLPGMEDQVKEDVRNLALVLFNTRADVTAAKGREKVDTENLEAVMEENGITSYYDQERDLTVEIEEKKHLKVTLGQRNVSPVMSPGPDAPITEQTLKPLPKKQKPNAGVPRAGD